MNIKPLNKLKCQPCEGFTKPLTREEAEEFRKQTPQWELNSDSKKISRMFKHKDFVAAMDFANKITEIAEEEGHHPDLHIGWGRVGVELWTHAIDGLSENDFIVAAKIDNLIEG